MEAGAVWLNPHLLELADAGWVIEFNRGRVDILEAFRGLNEYFSQAL